jgi:hypothetical protein
MYSVVERVPVRGGTGVGGGIVTSAAAARSASWAAYSASSSVPCLRCMARELNTRFIRIAVMAPAEIPESKMIWKDRGNSVYSSPETVGNRPMPRDMATTRMLALLNVTRVRVRMPLAATMPNSATPAPPGTATGMPATMPPNLGGRPGRIRTAPAKVATKRDLTPATRVERRQGRKR